MNSVGLTRNLPLKLLALLLALVVFAHVQTEKEQEKEFRVSLHLVGLPESLILGGGSPRHVAVRIRGKGKQLLKLKVQPPEVLVDLREAHPGVVQRMLSATDVVVPAGTKVAVAEVLEPRMVEITVDTLILKSLPVHAVWAGRPATAFAVAGPLEVAPAAVPVLGPARVLGDLASLATLPFDLGDARGDAWNEVLLDLPSGVRGVQSEAVRIRVPLVPASNRIFSSVPVRLEGLQTGWVAHLEPTVVEVLLAGPGPLLGSVPPESLRVLVLLEGREPGRYGLAPEVQVPFEPQLRLLRIRPSRVSVHLVAPDAGGRRTGN
jgi:YbbR domain-containing protein